VFTCLPYIQLPPSANTRSTCQKYPCHLCKPKILPHVQKNPPWHCILNQMNSINILTSTSSRSIFAYTGRYPVVSSLQLFRLQSRIHLSLMYVLYILRPLVILGLTILIYCTDKSLHTSESQESVSQGNGPIRHVETCPDFFFHCKSTHNKIHCQNISC
jgi:hypothetical protein